MADDLTSAMARSRDRITDILNKRSSRTRIDSISEALGNTRYLVTNPAASVTLGQALNAQRAQEINEYKTLFDVVAKEKQIEQQDKQMTHQKEAFDFDKEIKARQLKAAEDKFLWDKAQAKHKAFSGAVTALVSDEDGRRAIAGWMNRDKYYSDKMRQNPEAAYSIVTEATQDPRFLRAHPKISLTKKTSQDRANELKELEFKFKYDPKEIKRREDAKNLSKTEATKELFKSVGLGDPEGAAAEVASSKMVNAPVVSGGVGDKYKSLMSQIKAAQKLILAGETQIGRGLLTAANTMAKFDGDVGLQIELNKVLDPSVAAELGLPFGSTGRDALGRHLMTDTEKAEQKTMAQERAKRRVKDEVELGFVNEAKAQLSDLRGKLKADPKLVGIIGSVRTFGKNAIGILSDAGLKSFIDRAQSVTQDLPESFQVDLNDPTLDTKGIIENSIGLILARTYTPQGRIPVDVIKRAMSEASLGGMVSSERVINRIEALSEKLAARERTIRDRNDIPNESAPKKTPGRFRVIGGKLVKEE